MTQELKIKEEVILHSTLQNELLVGQGLLARCLIVAPETNAWSRKYNPIDVSNEPIINKIGWNPVRILGLRENWGLEKIIKQGQGKKLFIPPGIVIPPYVNSILHKVKIRRSDWYMGAPFPKYQIIAGSKNHVSTFGNCSNPIAVIVEAELDAILITQEAGDPFCVVALGGASIRSVLITHQWLRTKKLILFSLDFDEAGKQAYGAYWKKVYPNFKPWPTPFEKSPGDAFHRGLNLKERLDIGITR